ncbi:hypothetical protein FWC63_00935 [Candidatus Saccharibacteria bacterium]|nr:hypothetical protein [Candidatus Saccharibacteria bacterium]
MSKLRLLYIYTFLHYAGSSIGGLFSAVLLYTLGFSLSHVLVFYGLHWGVMGLITPLTPVIVAKIGYFRAEACAAIAILSANIILTTIPMEHANFAIFGLLLVLYGVGGALTVPIQFTMKVRFIPEEKRGTTNGQLFALRAVAVMCGSLLVGFFLSHTFVMITAIAGALLASLIPLGMMFAGTRRPPTKYSYKATLKAINSKQLRPFIPVLAIRSFMHVERVLVPLYIFLVVGDIFVLALYIVLATLVEMVVMMTFGGRYDKNRRRTFRTAAGFRSLASISLCFRPLVERVPIFGQIYSRIAGRSYDNIFLTYNQRIINKSKLDATTASSALETILCWTELVVCLVFAAMALTIGTDIFFVIFGASVFAAWSIYYRLRKV